MDNRQDTTVSGSLEALRAQIAIRLRHLEHQLDMASVGHTTPAQSFLTVLAFIDAASQQLNKQRATDLPRDSWQEVENALPFPFQPEL